MIHESRLSATHRRQRGLSLIGALILLAIVAAAGYYLYQSLATEGDEAPSCNAALTACLQKCRRTATDTESAQRCQGGCEREAAACERRDR